MIYLWDERQIFCSVGFSFLHQRLSQMPASVLSTQCLRDPKTNHKISLMAPALALGQAVHEVIESLSIVPIEKRFEESLLTKFDRTWEKVSGQKGGFEDTH